MISFDKINQFDPVYQLLNWFFRIDHNYIYYKKIQVIGYENVPPKGYPIFAISNHTNAVMDPLAMLYLYKDHRQPVFIARGDVFKKGNFIARLLRFLKILPTFRSRDGGRSDIRSNLDTFELAARILGEGGTLTMFPEAGHQAGKFFNTFKKGFPRVAFLAAEKSDYQLDFKILPMYVYYTDYFNMRGTQVIVIGEPFAISEFYELYKAEPNKAFLQMNEKAREAVRSLGIDVTDHEAHYPQYETLFKVCRSTILSDPHAFDGMELHGTERDRKAGMPYRQLLSDKKLVAVLERLRDEYPDRYEQLMADTAEYGAGLKQLRLRDWELERPITGGNVAGKGLLLLLTAPFALVGFLGNIIPFQAVQFLKRNLEDPMFRSTLNFVPGLIFFRLWYLILFILVMIFTKWWIGIIAVLVAFLTFIPFYEWKKSCIKWLSICRFRRYERKGNEVLAKLKALRKKLIDSIL